MTPLIPPDCLIACLGISFESGCAEAMARVSARVPHISVRFVDKAWLSESEFATAIVCWMLDAQNSLDGAFQALRAGVPLLVPVEKDELKFLCQTHGCGFSYQTSTEAVEWIVWILRHPSEQNEMSHRARASSVHFAHANAATR